MDSWFTNLAAQAKQLADGIVAQAESVAENAERELAKEHAAIKKEKEKEITVLNQLSSSRLPWEGEDESKAILEKEVMDSILALSMCEENFTRSPTDPILQNISFSFQKYVPVILRILKLDSNLARMHAKLSPKMNEEIFWRNFYLRVLYLRAKVGMDGEEAKTNLGRVQEEGFLFKYTALPPAPTTPSTKPPEPSSHLTLFSNLLSPSPTSPVFAGNTPPTPKYIEESFDEGEDLDVSAVSISNIPSKEPKKQKQQQQRQSSAPSASHPTSANTTTKPSSQPPSKSVTGTVMSQSVSSPPAVPPVTSSDPKVVQRREAEERERARKLEQARLAAEVEAELRDELPPSPPSHSSSSTSTSASKFSPSSTTTSKATTSSALAPQKSTAQKTPATSAANSSRPTTASVTTSTISTASKAAIASPIQQVGKGGGGEGAGLGADEDWCMDDGDLALALGELNDIDGELIDLEDDEELEAQIARELADDI